MSVGKNGGGGGIRTLGDLAATHDFQSCAFDHSATPPCSKRSANKGCSFVLGQRKLLFPQESIHSCAKTATPRAKISRQESTHTSLLKYFITRASHWHRDRTKRIAIELPVFPQPVGAKACSLIPPKSHRHRHHPGLKRSSARFSFYTSRKFLGSTHERRLIPSR
jgi:hypothetical protein